MKSTMTLASEIMSILVDKHVLWQRGFSNVTQEGKAFLFIIKALLDFLYV